MYDVLKKRDRGKLYKEKCKKSILKRKFLNERITEKFGFSSNVLLPLSETAYLFVEDINEEMILGKRGIFNLT